MRRFLKELRASLHRQRKADPVTWKGVKQMFELKYCVASVGTTGGEPYVAFYAFREGGFGLHKVRDWNDPAVQWYDTQEEAMEACWNANDCVVCRGFEEAEAKDRA